MRTASLGLVTVVLAALAFAGLGQNGELGRNVALFIVGACLIAEGWSTKRRDTEAQKLRAEAARTPQLESEVSRLKADLEKAKREAGEVAGLRADLKAAKAAQAAAGDAEVLAFLSLLQQKGRFLDFVMDDVSKYPDPQIGAAARVVHQGCSAVIREYFEIKPVHDGQEGGALTLAKDFDTNRYRLLGRVTGEPPFRGRVLHRGWLTGRVRLPERQGGAYAGGGVIAPAEVELS